MKNVTNPISLEPGPILDRIGYEGADNPSRRIVSLVDDYIENYNEFIAPDFAWAERPVENLGDNRVSLGDGIVLESPKLSRMLERCDRAVVFAVTIGGYLEAMVAQLSEAGQIVQATVLDAIGSGAAEKMAARFEERLRENVAPDGLVISRRFSPGYCDWNVSQQGELFKALGGDTAGIELTASQLMTPRKSVSGIIGVGGAGRDIENYNPCVTCKRKDCPGRRR